LNAQREETQPDRWKSSAAIGALQQAEVLFHAIAYRRDPSLDLIDNYNNHMLFCKICKAYIKIYLTLNEPSLAATYMQKFQTVSRPSKIIFLLEIKHQLDINCKYLELCGSIWTGHGLGYGNHGKVS
jgi:hypothetical protein